MAAKCTATPPLYLSVSEWTPDASGFRQALFPDDQSLAITQVPNTTNYKFQWLNINNHTRIMTLSWNSATFTFTGNSITIYDEHNTSIYAQVTITISCSNGTWNGSLSMPAKKDPTTTAGTFVAQATGGGTTDPDEPG